MAELADAADSKSAGPRALGGSTPPPGTNHLQLQRASIGADIIARDGTRSPVWPHRKARHQIASVSRRVHRWKVASRLVARSKRSTGGLRFISLKPMPTVIAQPRSA